MEREGPLLGPAPICQAGPPSDSPQGHLGRPGKQNGAKLREPRWGGRGRTWGLVVGGGICSLSPRNSAQRGERRGSYEGPPELAYGSSFLSVVPEAVLAPGTCEAASYLLSLCASAPNTPYFDTC